MVISQCTQQTIWGNTSKTVLQEKTIFPVVAWKITIVAMIFFLKHLPQDIVSGLAEESLNMANAVIAQSKYSKQQLPGDETNETLSSPIRFRLF